MTTVEYLDGVDLDTVRTVMLDEKEIAELRYACRVQSLRCKRLALELRKYVGDRDANGETFVDTIIEMNEAVEKAQSDLNKLKLMVLRQSIWVPTD